MGSAIDAARYREVLGHFATGLAVVTGLSERSPVGFTCQSFCALSLEPPLVLIAPSKQSTTWPRLVAAGVFTVNILSAEQEAIARAFSVSGADKFAGVGWRPAVTGAPILADALAHVDCTISSVTEAGDHYVVVGAVEELESSTGSPLLYYRGGFGQFQI